MVHVKNEYDYDFESQYRNDIFDSIKYIWWKANKINIPVYGVPDSLKKYHTSKRDISQGQEVDPDEKFRLKDEDIYPEDPNAAKGGAQPTAQFLAMKNEAQTAGNVEINEAN